MTRKSKTPHDEDAGFQGSRKNPLTGSWTILYDGEEADFDTEEGRWSLFCSEHGTLFHDTNKRRAQKLMGLPAAWCTGCQRRAEEIEIEKAPKPMKRLSDDADREREMRFWARKARNNPEKCRLFEQMYGVKPDAFWD